MKKPPEVGLGCKVKDLGKIKEASGPSARLFAFLPLQEANSINLLAATQLADTEAATSSLLEISASLLRPSRQVR